MASKRGIVICLMRNDLRFHDNELLSWANKNGSFVLPVYCFDPRHFTGTYNFGFPKTGPHRLKFLLESVKDFRNTLKQHGRINAVGGADRRKEELLKKWTDMKSRTKKKEQMRLKKLGETGSGGGPVRELSSLEEKVLSLIPRTLVKGVKGGTDTCPSKYAYNVLKLQNNHPAPTLNKRGGLIVRHDKPEVVIPDIIQKLGGKEAITAIAFHKEVTQDQLDIEKAVQQKCGAELIHSVWGHTLFHVDDLPFKINHLPDVYTQFRKSVEGSSQVRKITEMPDQLNPLPDGVEEGEIPSMEQLGVKPAAPDARTAFPFSGGETTGLERLNNFLWETDNVATYKETRNGMIGAEYSTKFSTWLSLGCLSPRRIYYEIKKYEQERTANQSTYWVIFELLWRDYFRFVAMKYGNAIFQQSGIQGKDIPWKNDKNLFEAWKEGRTGVPYVDANMREVAATGFMSNRGRQNVASFLTKDLKLDWRLGAEWFESMLLDHDVCSNYGNWLYSAGLGNDPREDRKFNMVKQGLDYDPNGDYVRLWVPELSELKDGTVHTVWTLSNNALSRAGISLGEAYPNPIVIAPEWQRHAGKTRGGGSRGGARGGNGGRGNSAGQQRGMDFYFKGN